MFTKIFSGLLKKRAKKADRMASVVQVPATPIDAHAPLDTPQLRNIPQETRASTNDSVWDAIHRQVNAESDRK